MRNATAIQRYLTPALLTMGIAAQAAETMPPFDFRQEKPLEESTPSDRFVGSRGRVIIYDGLDAGTVDPTMEKHVDRVRNVVLRRVQHPTPTSEATTRATEEDCN